jgi:hypothetical protein
MTIYVGELNSSDVTTLEHTDDTGTYSAELPLGTYVAYASREGYELGGSYFQAVPCGLSVDCVNHSLIQF